MPGAIKGLFKAAKALACSDDAPRPETRRRRTGETDKGFVAVWRTVLRRAATKTRAAARGRFAALRPVKADVSTKAAAIAETMADRLAKAEPVAFAPADACAGTGMYLADTLEWLNLWQDNANNEQWFDGDFNAKQDHDFPQP